MTPRPIQATVRTRGDDPGGSGLSADFREAMAAWPAGVVVVAVRDDDEVLGMTASAFTSVSADPPLVLVCVSEHAPILFSLLDEGRFTVNLLAAGQARAAAAFADKLPPDPGLFADDADDAGDPVLRGALATFVCTLWAEHPGGDHRVVIGRVERVVLGADAPPLVYHRRGYRGLEG